MPCCGAVAKNDSKESKKKVDSCEEPQASCDYRVLGAGDEVTKLDIKPDSFVNSVCVSGLTCESFQPYLEDVDVAMVMFYNVDDQQSMKSRNHFKRAAELTNTPGRLYAAVDCEKDNAFCAMEGVQSVPHFRIYSKGIVVDSLKTDPKKFVFTSMKEWVESFPLPFR